MKNKILLAVLVILIIVFVFISNKKEDSTVKIVALYPLTGGLASWGESAQKSTQLAVDEINEKGGVDGKKIEVIYADHKCDTKTALSEFQRYISEAKIFTSSSCSGTVVSISPNLQKNNAVLLATVVASAKITGVSPYVFRNWAVESRQAALVGQKIKELNLKKVGVIYEETDYAKGLKISLENYLQGSGVIIQAESFATGSTDARTQLAKLMSSNLDAIFISPQTETSGEVILSQMEQLGFKPKLFVNDIVFGSTKMIAKHTATLEGALGGNYVIQSDKLQTMLDSYKNKYGSDCAHAGACAVAYDSMNILAEAIKNNGDSADEIQEYLKTVNYAGVSGITSFDSNNDRSGVGYSLSIITDGKVVLVK